MPPFHNISFKMITIFFLETVNRTGSHGLSWAKDSRGSSQFQLYTFVMLS